MRNKLIHIKPSKIKRILTILILLGTVIPLSAQITNDAFGIRFGGDRKILGIELNYQVRVSDANRIEMGAGIFTERLVTNGYFIVGFYQWDWTINGGLNWYLGPGAGVSIFVENSIIPEFQSNLGIGAQMGIEYNFTEKSFPILISLDTRPMWDVFGEYSEMNISVALGIRVLISKDST